MDMQFYFEYNWTEWLAKYKAIYFHYKKKLKFYLNPTKLFTSRICRLQLAAYRLSAELVNSSFTPSLEGLL